MEYTQYSERLLQVVSMLPQLVKVPTGQGDVPLNDVTIESATFVGSVEVDPWYKFW